MSDVRELYQEVILDHNRSPRNFGKPAGANRQAVGYNPLCGDRVTVYLTLEDGVVKEAGFEGNGCAISTASGSMMTQALQGKSIPEVDALFQRFHELVAGKGGADDEAVKLGRLEVFAGVREFPVRVKCATLVWHTLRAALKENEALVTTE